MAALSPSGSLKSELNRCVKECESAFYHSLYKQVSVSLCPHPHAHTHAPFMTLEIHFPLSRPLLWQKRSCALRFLSLLERKDPHDDRAGRVWGDIKTESQRQPGQQRKETVFSFYFLQRSLSSVMDHGCRSHLFPKN